MANILCMWCMLGMIGALSAASVTEPFGKENNQVYGPLTERETLEREVKQRTGDIVKLHSLEYRKDSLLERPYTAKIELLNAARKKSKKKTKQLRDVFYTVALFNAMEMFANSIDYKEIFLGTDENGRNFFKRIFRDKDTTVAALRLFGPALLWFFVFRQTWSDAAAIKEAEEQYQSVLKKVADEDKFYSQYLATLIQKYEGE